MAQRSTSLLDFIAAKSIFIYVFTALLILGPALNNGFVLLLDMAWPSNFQLSDALSGGLQPQLPVFAVLTILNVVFPSWILQKMVLIGILAGSGYATESLLRRWVPPAYAMWGGLLAMLNPFVAERFLAGQWLVLAGYAFAPFVLHLLLKALRNNDRQSFMRFWVAFTVFPMISVHWWIMMTPLLILVALRFNRKRMEELAHETHLWLTPVFAFVISNSYWLLSVILGTNERFGRIDSSNFEAFQTLRDETVGIFGNVLSLYGFWRQDYDLPKDDNSIWFFYALVVLGLAIWGSWYARRKMRNRELRAVATSLVFIFPVALVLAVGYSHYATRPVIYLLEIIPGAQVLRDTSKFIGLLALTLSLLTPIGLFGVWKLIKKQQAKLNLAAVAASTFTVLNMGGMLWGFNGQLQAFDYPETWYSVNEAVAPDATVLVLPWQGYLDVYFANNQFMANPARSFFSFEVVQARSANNPLLDDRADPMSALIDAYLKKSITYDEFTTILQDNHNIRHIVLLKIGNWQRNKMLIGDAQKAGQRAVNNQDISLIRFD